MPDAPRPPWNGGTVNRAWAQRSGDRRVFSSRPPSPPHRPPHAAAAANCHRGEGGSGGGAAARRDAGKEEASGRYTRRGGGVAEDREVAVPVGSSADPAGRNAAPVAVPAGGAAPAPPPREEGGGVGSKRPFAPPVPPPPKRRSVSPCRQFPFMRRAPPPLAGADAVTGSRKRYGGGRENRPAVARPLAARKDGVGSLSRAVRPNAAGTRVPNKKLYATDGAAPVENTGRHVPKAVMVKSSSAQDRGRGAGTDDELRGKKVLVRATRLPPKPEIISATRTSVPGHGKDGGYSSKVHRPLESGHAHGGSAVPKEVQHIPFSRDKKETVRGRQVTTNGIQGSVELTKNRVIQAPDMRLMTHKKAPATRDFFGHRKIVKPLAVDHHQRKIVLTSVSGSKGKLDDEVAPNLKFHDIFRKIVFHEGKLELHLNSSLGILSVRCQRQYRHRNADARCRFKMLCRMFEFVCRTLVQIIEQRSLKMRIDFVAAEAMKTLPGFTKHDPIVGQVPGVEVGDEFLYRSQLVIAGLHSHSRKGIATTTDRNGMLIAVSIVASGGYPDELGCSGELIYTGSGGKPSDEKKDGDQKLERGNLALKNCIKTKTPVRVIHGFKCGNTEGGSHSGAKLVSKYTYDGLYLVVDFWMDGQPGSRVFKYKLKKIRGQPELPMHIVKRLKSFKSRPGLCMTDISQKKEATPICVINTVDDVRPAPFKYTIRIRYLFGLTVKHHQGCDCTNGCSDSVSCACAMKNGGEIPFDSSGRIINEKSVIFECGPSCKCSPSCHNRVSQHGMKIPLEVFRTTKTGWGVRSLSSIPSGSFVCEYIGELLHQKEAGKSRNNSYLFDIGLNYGDENVSSGLLSNVSGVNSSSSCSQGMDSVRFTIDASEYGNIGRFINHSCSPNLQAQNVLWDHDDKRMPHIMFFAAETIPPLQELTYDYNNSESVRGLNRRMKSKVCQCGSSQCRRRFY